MHSRGIYFDVFPDTALWRTKVKKSERIYTFVIL
mgnify:CR=1 FL=1